MLLFLACKAPPPAPTEMNELARFLVREFEGEDETLAEGLVNLYALLDDIDLDSDPSDRVYELQDVTTEDLAGLERPDRAPSDCETLAIAATSTYELDAHTGYMVLDDLTVISTTAEIYDRTMDVDPACFQSGECPVMRTTNHIYRDAWLFQMEYDFDKDYRWVETERGRVVLARGWIPTSAHGNSDANHIWQNYEVDVYLEAGQDTWRFYGIWTEAEYAGVNEETARNLSISSAVDALEMLEEWLGENT